MDMDKTLLENVMDCGNTRDFENFNYKVIVLDDDPTGTQTVKDLNVYTSWEEEYVRDGFRSDNNMFYIMTNSRAFSEEETRSEEHTSELQSRFELVCRLMLQKKK